MITKQQIDAIGRLVDKGHLVTYKGSRIHVINREDNSDGSHWIYIEWGMHRQESEGHSDDFHLEEFQAYQLNQPMGIS